MCVGRENTGVAFVNLLLTGGFSGVLWGGGDDYGRTIVLSDAPGIYAVFIDEKWSETYRTNIFCLLRFEPL